MRHNSRGGGGLGIAAALLLSVISGFGQNYSQGGFVETRLTAYPQTASNDRARSVGEALFRYEGTYKPTGSLQLSGSIDLRADSHHEVDRKLNAIWWDRGKRRPALAVRRISALYHNGGLSLEIGKQFIRWGKADILNPTDRLAPRDFLNVVDNDFLGVTATRLSYEKGSDTIDVVWVPRFTPSRIPLADQRWIVPPPDLPANVRGRDGGTDSPGGPQAGLRWSHLGVVEFSGSYYEGFNHLPSFEKAVVFDRGSVVVNLQRFHAQMRMFGADAAMPLRWLTVKGETAYFTSRDPRADEYAQYVLQLERQAGEWSLVGGYAGEWVRQTGTQAGTFAPDRSLTKTVLASARLAIDANRSVSVESSIRQNLEGAWIRAEYSHAFGQNWRTTTAFSLIRGAPTDFLGQYRRNSHATVILRYSF